RVLNDFGQILKLAANKRLNEVKMMADPRTCATVFAVSGGYPESYEKDKRIEFRPHEAQDTIVFHAGTKLDENDILTNGGRVLAVSAFGDSIQSAITKSYKGIQNISFDKMYYRKDIGQDLLTLSK
ncbi:MAG: phosphoribosylamine--glycine ligase, partial [bacterium]